MADDVFYVGIPDPKEVRRYVLESSKSMIDILKRYEELKAVREEKLEVQIEYDQNMKQVLLLCNRLKKEFPEITAKMPVLKARVHPSVKIKEEEPKRYQKREDTTELDKLEHEMDMIEEKLKEL